MNSDTVFSKSTDKNQEPGIEEISLGGYGEPQETKTTNCLTSNQTNYISKKNI